MKKILNLFKTKNEQTPKKRLSIDKSKRIKPGTVAPKSGQYLEIGPRGGGRREITAVKGRPLPPPSAKGSTYILVDATKNKSGK